LRSYPCYGGLDLAAVNDLTAFVLAWPIGGRVYVHPWFFLPDDGLAERGKRDNVEYVRWAQEGYLILTPGNATDWRHVTEHIKMMSREYDIQSVGYDRYGAVDVAADLNEHGIKVEPLGQGYISTNAPCKRLEQLVLTRKLVHSGHPILRWNMDCTTISSDPAGNIKPIKPDRQKGSKRIDGVYALWMAIRQAMDATDVTAGVRSL
jgi:phage terminase large subunit-like protein